MAWICGLSIRGIKPFLLRFCEFYGIEAGMAALITEIKEVFGAYGIKVDARHLTLVADYVTQHGVYRPFNRYLCFFTYKLIIINYRF